MSDSYKDNNDLSYFDENPAEDPFTTWESSQDDADYKAEVTSNLLHYMDEYLTFSTMRDLLKLIVENA